MNIALGLLTAIPKYGIVTSEARFAGGGCLKMAFDLLLRMQTKWRGLLVFFLLNIGVDALTQILRLYSSSAQMHLGSRLVAIVTALFCLYNTARLLFTDQEGDEGWPRFWG